MLFISNSNLIYKYLCLSELSNLALTPDRGDFFWDLAFGGLLEWKSKQSLYDSPWCSTHSQYRALWKILFGNFQDGVQAVYFQWWQQLQPQRRKPMNKRCWWWTCTWLNEMLFLKMARLVCVAYIWNFCISLSELRRGHQSPELRPRYERGVG